jgi:hypothetical protein
MNTEKLRSLIRESIQDYIKEIDGAAEDAAMEARISKCEEAIQMRETKLGAISESDHKDLMDEGKIKGLENEIKELKKAKAKFEKIKEKKANKKSKKGEKVEDTEGKEIVDEISLSENEGEERYDEDGNIDPNGMYDVGGNYIGATDTARDKAEYDKDPMNESFLKMQKLAGVITETQYNQKKALIETLFLGDEEEMEKSGASKEYTDKEIESMSLEDAKKLYSSTKKSWDVPANDKLKKQLMAKIEKEDPKFFKSAKNSSPSNQSNHWDDQDMLRNLGWNA